jgi:hypothetical protein
MEIVRNATERRPVKVLLRRRSKVAFSSNLTCSPWRSSNAIITVLKRCSSWCNSFSTVTWIPENVISSILLHNGEIWTASLQPRHGPLTERNDGEIYELHKLCLLFLLARIGPVTKVTGYWLCERCSISGRDKDFSLRHYVQTGTNPMDTGGSLLR